MSEVIPRVSLTGGIPSIGALLGNGTSAEVIQELNARLGATYVGTRYDDVHNAFIQNVIMPIRSSEMQLKATAEAFMAPDKIRVLDSIDLLRETPLSMHMPIMMFPPIRKLALEGRIDGFGYFPEYIPEEDVYGRLITNGRVEDIANAADPETHTAVFKYEWNTTDPNLTLTELDDIERTRDFILSVLDTTELDPTDVDNIRG